MKANLLLAYDWVPVESAPGVAYAFGQPVSPYLRQAYARPAVYRWRIRPGPEGEAELRYIGETEDLPRRMYHCLKPGPSQQTDLRLHGLLMQALDRRAHVQAEVLRVDSCEVNGRLAAESSFADSGFRRCLEELLTFQPQYARQVPNRTH